MTCCLSILDNFITIVGVFGAAVWFDTSNNYVILILIDVESVYTEVLDDGINIADYSSNSAVSTACRSSKIGNCNDLITFEFKIMKKMDCTNTTTITIATIHKDKILCKDGEMFFLFFLFFLFAMHNIKSIYGLLN